MAICLAPGTFVRSAIPPHDFTSPVTISPLALQTQAVGELQLEAGWLLESENDLFGGWSAMVDWIDDSLLVGSDAARVMVLKRPDQEMEEPRLGAISWARPQEKRDVDLESLSRDPVTNELWAGFERSNSVVRIVRPLRPVQSFSPPEMADWPANAGPESLVRFPDGRLLVVAETAVAKGRHDAVLFPSGVGGPAAPVRFLVEAPEDYRPSDAALLPDGRLLFLLRGVDWGFPPSFPAMLAVADPSGIVEGGVMPMRELARIEEPLPSDNFEGLAVMEEADKSLAIWLISDDNFNRYQQTLLLKLVWEDYRTRTRQKARR